MFGTAGEISPLNMARMNLLGLLLLVPLLCTAVNGEQGTGWEGSLGWTGWIPGCLDLCDSGGACVETCERIFGVEGEDSALGIVLRVVMQCMLIKRGLCFCAQLPRGQ